MISTSPLGPLAAQLCLEYARKAHYKQPRSVAKIVRLDLEDRLVMVALLEGTQSPDLSLRTVEGTKYSLYQRLKDSPLVLLAFFKVSCPVVQLEFPYLERLHRSYPQLHIWGISQDDADATATFRKMFGVTFPTLLDDDLGYTAQYGLVTVPSLFLISNERTITQTIEGFNKAALEKLNLNLASAAGVSSKPLFSSADEVPEFRPGCMSKQPA